jgi:hypothetical protein
MQHYKKNCLKTRPSCPQHTVERKWIILHPITTSALKAMIWKTYQNAFWWISKRNSPVQTRKTGQKREDREKTDSSLLMLNPPLRAREKSVCLCCVWTLPEPRCKSYSDKSPRDTNSSIYNRERFLACLPFPLTTNAEHNAIFLIQRQNGSEQ